jgi:hypothetical protein
MLTMIGTLWPVVGLPASILLASMTGSTAWRWAALIGAPALVYAVHYWIVLPACLQDGNLLAAVIFGAMIMAGAIYFPVVLAMATLWFVRRGLSWNRGTGFAERRDGADLP